MDEQPGLQRCAEFDKSAYPLVKITMQTVVITDYNFQLYLDELSELYVSKEDIYLVIDARAMRIPSLRYLRMLADWVRDNSTTIQTQCVACATVVGSSLMRAVADLANTMFRIPTSYVIFTDQIEAEEWVKSRMTQ